MRFDTIYLDEVNIGREIERFISFTDRNHWEDVVQKFDRNPGITYRYFLNRRNPLIAPLKEYADLSKKGKSIWKNKTPGIEFLAINAFTINNITKNLSETARKKFLPRLKVDDIRSLLFELRIASHFLRKNFNVEFTEYESTDDQKRTFDFLVSKDSHQGEVECKFKTFDAGKAITTDGFYLLCDEIYTRWLKTDIHCLLEITCHDKLGKNRQKFAEIATAIISAINNREKNTKIGDEFEVAIHYLSSNIVIKTPQQLDNVIKDYRTPKSHFASLGDESKTLIIKIETSLEESVLTNIFEELKEASKQFSTEKPGLIACHIEGIFPNEWAQLKGDSSLAIMTYEFFKREGSKHIHTIGYSSVSEPQVLHSFKEFQTPGLMFCNPDCVFDIEQDIFAFRSKSETDLVW